MSAQETCGSTLHERCHSCQNGRIAFPLHDPFLIQSQKDSFTENLDSRKPILSATQVWRNNCVLTEATKATQCLDQAEFGTDHNLVHVRHDLLLQRSIE